MRTRLARLVCVLFLISTFSPAQEMRENQPDRPIGKTVRDQVIQDIVTDLDQSYIYPEVASAMGKHLLSRKAAGAYDAITSSREFAKVLTDDLQSISHDKHLRVFYSYDPLPPMTGGPSAIDLQHMREEMARTNFGFERVEVLPGNVGYLDLRGFVPLELGKDKAVASMRFLSDTDALIIDLRKNGGGSPDMVAFLCSYFFGDRKVHLNDLYWRERNHTDEWWTTPDVPGPKYGNKPVYLLTSPFTFSAAEEFAYDLQNQKRVTIVGETTGGGAHPGGPARLNEHFGLGIPRGRAINPITKTDWEGVGAKPEIAVDSASALKTAQVAAVKQILSHTTDAHHREELKDVIAEIH
ncbi:MAG: S41 family peptidase [Acidobacteriaceae bacterium]|nr:S41 family peptidase [Acidobacteriaceae bacterium]